MTTGTFPSLKISSSGVLYAGDATGTIHRSADNGKTWTTGSVGMPLGIIDIEIKTDDITLRLNFSAQWRRRQWSLYLDR